MENKKRAMLLHEEDNVIIAIETIEPGEIADAGSVKVTVNEAIARGHKIAIKKLRQESHL